MGVAWEGEWREDAARYHLNVTSSMPRRRDALLTVLFPRLAAGAAPQIEPLLDGQGEGARVSVDGRVYRVLMGRDGEGIDLDGCSCDGDAAVLFEDGDGTLKRAVRVGGTRLSVAGREVAGDLLTAVE